MGSGPKRYYDSFLSVHQLAALKQELARLGRSDLAQRYLKYYENCRCIEDVPKAADVQRFVAAWKEMRKRRINWGQR